METTQPNESTQPTRKRIRAPKPVSVLTVLGPIAVDTLSSLVRVLPKGTMITQTTSIELDGKPRAVFEFLAPPASGGTGDSPQS